MVLPRRALQRCLRLVVAVEMQKTQLEGVLSCPLSYPRFSAREVIVGRLAAVQCSPGRLNSELGALHGTRLSLVRGIKTNRDVKDGQGKSRRADLAYLCLLSLGFATRL